MRYARAKKASDIALAGIAAELNTRDGSVYELVLSDQSGSKLVITGDWSGLTINVPEPPKMVERFRLSGKVAGLDVSECFKTQHEADLRKDGLSEMTDDSLLSIEKVSVPDEASL